MKKSVLLILACCLLFFTGCRKDDYVTNSYRASMEYHIADSTNAQSVHTLLKGYRSVWLSEISLTLVNVSTTDAEAYTKFETSIMAIDSKRNSWRSFLDEEDYMIYKLERTTPGKEEVLRTVRFDSNGRIVL